jgi:hypothetical protein
MTNPKLDELLPKGALLLEPREVYDDAIIGTTFDGRAIYDSEHVIRCTMNADGVSFEDAVEWHEYNTFTAYQGPRTPLYVDLNFKVDADDFAGPGDAGDCAGEE